VIEVDAKQAEEFGHRMLGTVNGAMLALGISLGHPAGLYDALAELDAASSDEIALHAGLQERYVREWLAGQLAGAIVDAHAGADTSCSRSTSCTTWPTPTTHCNRSAARCARAGCY
jgi:hypothetical protein